MRGFESVRTLPWLCSNSMKTLNLSAWRAREKTPPKALLAVPANVADGAMRQALEALANEMMVDLEAAESLAG